MAEADHSADRKHILIISQYFYPESFRINDIAAQWAENGYRVTVLTGIPNYPQGKFYHGYGWMRKRTEIRNGVQIIRLPILARGKSTVRLALNYLSFLLSGLLWACFSRTRADMVFTFGVSPMTQALIGIRYAHRRGIPHFLYVQDLWPESVEAATGIRSPALIEPLRAVTDRIYRRCTKIFATSPAFAQAICERLHGQTEKVVCWPQFAEDFYIPNAVASSQIPCDGILNITFTGNIGTAQGLETLPEAAVALKQRGIRVRFNIVGDGRRREALARRIRALRVEPYFRLLGWQPPTQIPSILAASDVAYVSFADEPIYAMTIPAKLQSYLACAMPILACARGETERIIREAACGICCPIGDARALCRGIEAMLAADRRQMAANAHAYFLRHFRREALMAQMETHLRQALCMRDAATSAPPRVLIVNTVCGVGSTGRMALAQADRYRSQGYEVKIAYGRGTATERGRTIAYRIGSKADVLCNALSARLWDAEGFCAVRQTKKFLRWAQEYDPQVLLLHNLHGYYLNLPLLFAWIKSRPHMLVRWTLHDCWAFTGHCAHFADIGCEAWRDGCSHCPQKGQYPKSVLFDRSRQNFTRKKRALCGVKNMTLVAPSQWLADLASESFLREYPIEVVRNTVDTAVFCPTPSDFRERFALREKKLVLGVAAVWSRKKGLDDFLRLSAILDERFAVVLVGLTPRQKRNMPKNIIGLEKTTDARALAQIYTAADVFVNFTYEDTYPTVNLEAIACGTPCFSYDSGGSAETVPPENLVGRGDISAMAEKIRRVCSEV